MAYRSRQEHLPLWVTVLVQSLGTDPNLPPVPAHLRRRAAADERAVVGTAVTVFLAVSRSSRREAHGERTSPTFGGFFQSATLSCVETEDGEEEEAMIYKGASLLRAIGQLEGRMGKRGSSYSIKISQ